MLNLSEEILLSVSLLLCSMLWSLWFKAILSCLVLCFSAVCSNPWLVLFSHCYICLYFCIFHATSSNFLSTNHVRAYDVTVSCGLHGAGDVIIHTDEQKVNTLARLHPLMYRISLHSLWNSSLSSHYNSLLTNTLRQVMKIHPFPIFNGDCYPWATTALWLHKLSSVVNMQSEKKKSMPCPANHGNDIKSSGA